jgi:predicted dehydrogenase
MEGMWTWFLPAVRKAKEWVDAGRIGELLHIKADFGYPAAYAAHSRRYDVTLGGGCLLEMGIYPIAIARYFADRDPATIEVVSRHAPNGVEDDVVMLFEYGDGLLATLATSFRCKLPNVAYLVGSEGWIAIPDFWRAGECRLFVLDEPVDSYTDRRSGTGFEYQIREVCDDILQGRQQSPVVSHAASLALQQDMDRVRERFPA